MSHNNKLLEEGSSHLLLEAWIRHDSIDFHKFGDEKAEVIRERLLNWYDSNRKTLPWRGDCPPWEGSTANFGKKDAQKGNNQRNIKEFFAAAEAPVATAQKSPGELSAFPVSAYGVWVSEIMLQQTRVEAVVPYWVRWMEKFPTVHGLAAATEEEVNALWAGLGFYRRARMLHKAAKQVVEEYEGQMPTTVDSLLKLPGIGR